MLATLASLRFESGLDGVSPYHSGSWTQLTSKNLEVSPAHEPFPRSAGFSPLSRPPDQHVGNSDAPRQPRPLKRTKVRAPSRFMVPRLRPRRRDLAWAEKRPPGGAACDGER